MDIQRITQLSLRDLADMGYRKGDGRHFNSGYRMAVSTNAYCVHNTAQKVYSVEYWVRCGTAEHVTGLRDFGRKRDALDFLRKLTGKRVRASKLFRHTAHLI